MPTLDLTYLEIYTAVSNYLGLGNPTTKAAELITVKNIVKRGYRKFLMPVDASTGSKNTAPKPFRWSFLRQTTTLSTVAGQETYILPSGYNGMVIPLKHQTDETFNPVEVPLAVIYQRKSESTSDSYPLYFAIKEGDFSKAIGRVRELMFFPIPGLVYDYYYTYWFMPEAPVEDEDLFVGPVGGSEAILECCLAVAELQEKDQLGVHNTEANILVQQLIGDDKLGSLVGNIGGMASGSRPRRSARIFSDSTQIIPA